MGLWMCSTDRAYGAMDHQREPSYCHVCSCGTAIAYGAPCCTGLGHGATDLISSTDTASVLLRRY
eukprot:1046898-Rhodomonas_salina.1